MSASGNSDADAEFHRELYSQFRGPLIAFFMKRVTNRSEAEDLTQETFLRLINSATLDRSAPPSGYVFRIAANLLADRGRAAARRRYVSASTLDQGFLEALTREVVEDREPERVLIGRQSLSEVYRTLDELGERTKSIFILHRLEGMKQKEIAALYNVSVTTVEREILRAVLHIAKRFGPRTP